MNIKLKSTYKRMAGVKEYLGRLISIIKPTIYAFDSRNDSSFIINFGFFFFVVNQESDPQMEA